MPDDLPDEGAAYADDIPIIEGLRARDEATFAALVDRYSASLLRLARVYVRDS
jgi:hypothetical protein